MEDIQKKGSPVFLSKAVDSQLKSVHVPLCMQPVPVAPAYFIFVFNFILYLTSFTCLLVWRVFVVSLVVELLFILCHSSVAQQHCIVYSRDQLMELKLAGLATVL